MGAGGTAIVCVILAAGASLRFGTAKLTQAIGDRSLIERALDAARNYTTIIVAAPSLVPHIAPSAARTIIVNAHPQDGMTRSLALANTQAPAGAALAVLLADMPFVDADFTAFVAAAYDESIDIVDPRIGEVPAHPVIFGPAARARIAQLPPGDTLRELRGAGGLRRRTLACEGLARAIDVDTPDDLAHARTAAGSPGTIVPKAKL